MKILLFVICALLFITAFAPPNTDQHYWRDVYGQLLEESFSPGILALPLDLDIDGLPELLIQHDGETRIYSINKFTQELAPYVKTKTTFTIRLFFDDSEYFYLATSEEKGWRDEFRLTKNGLEALFYIKLPEFAGDKTRYFLPDSKTSVYLDGTEINEKQYKEFYQDFKEDPVIYNMYELYGVEDIRAMLDDYQPPQPVPAA